MNQQSAVTTNEAKCFLDFIMASILFLLLGTGEVTSGIPILGVKHIT